MDISLSPTAIFSSIRLSIFATLPVDDVAIGDLATKDVERAADSQIDTALTEILDSIQIVEGANAACVGHGNWRVRTQQFNQIGLNALHLAFDVNAMDQELVTVVGKQLERFRTNRRIGEALPAVGDDPKIISSPSTAQIEHQPLFSLRRRQAPAGDPYRFGRPLKT